MRNTSFLSGLFSGLLSYFFCAVLLLGYISLGNHSFAATTPAAEQKASTYYDLPEMLVNLKTTSPSKAVYLKTRITLELNQAQDSAAINLILPKIVDAFQTYFRSLRVEDVKGEPEFSRVREDLVFRVNRLAAPIQIKSLLFQEMLVQ
jgi:flagellar FliL protein